MKPPPTEGVRQLQHHKGSVQKLNRQRNILSERRTEKINEEVDYSIGLFVTICIGLGLFVAVMKTGEVVAVPIKESAVIMTDSFNAMTDMIKSAVPTVILIALFVAFIKLRQTDSD